MLIGSKHQFARLPNGIFVKRVVLGARLTISQKQKKMATFTMSKVILLAILVQIQLFSVNCAGPYITGCKFVRHEETQQNELSIVCSDDVSKNKTDEFIAADRWKCDHSYTNRFNDEHFSQMDIVSFADCYFTKLPAKVLSKFTGISNLNATSIGLKEFGVDDLPTSHWKLDTLILTQNKLENINQEVLKQLPLLKALHLRINDITELPSFVDNPELEILALMYNKLKQIPNDAFKGLAKLKHLELSYNALTSAALQFDEETKLEILLLNNNPIEVLRVGDFQHVKHLKGLTVEQALLRQIELGTFASLTALEKLVLSNNALKEFDFGEFLPSLQALKTLKLDGNVLTELDSNFDQIFPRLNQLVITRNKFNCTYLKEFLRTLRLNPSATDENDSHLNNPNIRGISCKDVQVLPEVPLPVQPKEKVQRGFESGYNVSIFILVLWISLTNLVICGVIALVGRRTLHFQSS